MTHLRVLDILALLCQDQCRNPNEHQSHTNASFAKGLLNLFGRGTANSINVRPCLAPPIKKLQFPPENWRCFFLPTLILGPWGLQHVILTFNGWAKWTSYDSERAPILHSTNAPRRFVFNTQTMLNSRKVCKSRGTKQPAKKKTWWFLLDMHENIMQIKALPTQRIHDLSGFTSENKLEHPVPAENHRRLIYETGLSVLFERL